MTSYNLFIFVTFWYVGIPDVPSDEYTNRSRRWASLERGDDSNDGIQEKLWVVTTTSDTASLGLIRT